MCDIKKSVDQFYKILSIDCIIGIWVSLLDSKTGWDWEIQLSLTKEPVHYKTEGEEDAMFTEIYLK